MSVTGLRWLRNTGSSTCCGKRRRHCLVLLTVSCAVCMLLWQRPEPNLEKGALYIENGQEIPRSKPLDFNKLGGGSETSLNDTYLERQRASLLHCQQKHGSSWREILNTPSFEHSPIISLKHNLMYCPVGKVASSFFTRFVIAMDTPGEMTSPFLIPIEKAGRDRCSSLKSLGPVVKQRQFLQNSTKIVFGRNPYSRIFSAYIDKLFSPNPFYWNTWGRPALNLGKTSRSTSCASDVTFQQFVRLVVSDLHKKDVHLKQVFDECQMCHVAYDIIGKIESTKSDLKKISSVLKISSQYLNETNYDLDSAMDAVYDSVKSAFAWKNDIKKCMSLDDMGLKLWRKLQIRGLFYNSIPFPFKPGDIENMAAGTFISACRDAILVSTDKIQLKKQKNQALREAYSSVARTLLLDVMNVYSDDFKTFGYDPEPSKLFGNLDEFQNTGALSWKKSWLLN